MRLDWPRLKTAQLRSNNTARNPAGARLYSAHAPTPTTVRGLACRLVDRAATQHFAGGRRAHSLADRGPGLLAIVAATVPYHLCGAGPVSRSGRRQPALLEAPPHATDRSRRPRAKNRPLR